jgi:hypothetical protein
VCIKIQLHEIFCHTPAAAAAADDDDHHHHHIMIGVYE